MAFLNKNNFVRWENVSSETTQILSNAEFALDISGWSNVDHPTEGAGGGTWSYSAFDDGKAAAASAALYSNGLEQEITITGGRTYRIDTKINHCQSNNQDCQIWFSDGVGGLQLVFDESIGSSTTETFSQTVIADANYTKIVYASKKASSTNCTNLWYLRLYETVNVVLPVDCLYSLPLYEGDTMKVMINYTFNEYDEPFGGTKVGLYESNGEFIYLRDIATVNYYDLDGLDYFIYFEWVVPNLPEEQLRFVLYKDISGGDEILYVSNPMHKVVSTGNTAIVKYRNAVDAFDYLYSDVPAFYNQFRIDLWTGRPNYQENIRGYETYEGDFIKVKSDVTKLVEFETRFFDEGAHEAFSSMLAHSEIYIDTIQFKRTQDGSYDIAWHDFDDRIIANGSVNLLEVDYSTSVKKC